MRLTIPKISQKEIFLLGFFLLSFFNPVLILAFFLYLLINACYSLEIAVKGLILIAIRTIINPAIAIDISSVQLAKWLTIFALSILVIYKSRKIKKKAAVNRFIIIETLFCIFICYISLFNSSYPLVSIFKCFSYGFIKECNKIFGENENSNLVKKSGVQKLNGLQVLAHSRSRYIETGDFGRTERQREILIAVSEQIKKLEIWHTLKTAYSVLPLLTTDMGNIDLLKLGISICETGVNNIETHNIPVEASFEFDNIEGMDVMVPDLDICKQALKRIIYGE